MTKDIPISKLILDIKQDLEKGNKFKLVNNNNHYYQIYYLDYLLNKIDIKDQLHLNKEEYDFLFHINILKEEIFLQKKDRSQKFTYDLPKNLKQLANNKSQFLGKKLANGLEMRVCDLLVNGFVINQHSDVNQVSFFIKTARELFSEKDFDDIKSRDTLDDFFFHIHTFLSVLVKEVNNEARNRSLKSEKYTPIASMIQEKWLEDLIESDFHGKNIEIFHRLNSFNFKFFTNKLNTNSTQDYIYLENQRYDLFKDENTQAPLIWQKNKNTIFEKTIQNKEINDDDLVHANITDVNGFNLNYYLTTSILLRFEIFNLDKKTLYQNINKIFGLFDRNNLLDVEDNSFKGSGLTHREVLNSIIIFVKTLSESKGIAHLNKDNRPKINKKTIKNFVQLMNYICITHNNDELFRTGNKFFNFYIQKTLFKLINHIPVDEEFADFYKKSLLNKKHNASIQDSIFHFFNFECLSPTELEKCIFLPKKYQNIAFANDILQASLIFEKLQENNLKFTKDEMSFLSLKIINFIYTQVLNNFIQNKGTLESLMKYFEKIKADKIIEIFIKNEHFKEVFGEFTQKFSASTKNQALIISMLSGNKEYLEDAGKYLYKFYIQDDINKKYKYKNTKRPKLKI